MIRIFADFNCQDEDGSVRLSVDGSLEDIHRAIVPLRDGMRVVLYVPDELQVQADLKFDKNREIWTAKPDFNTLRHYR